MSHSKLKSIVKESLVIVERLNDKSLSPQKRRKLKDLAEELNQILIRLEKTKPKSSKETRNRKTQTKRIAVLAAMWKQVCWVSEQLYNLWTSTFKSN